MFENPTEETLKALKSSLDPKLHKTVTTGSGLVGIDLQAPAKNLYPVITPLRNSIPRKSRAANPGLGPQWRQVTAINGSGFGSMGWVPEGQRSGTMSYTTAQKSASYVKIGEEDALTLEAEAAAQGFEDENAMVTFRLLQKMMQKEEFALLGGNTSVQLGTPTAPTLSASGSGATLPTLNPYSVIVVALTLEGFNNASLANGVGTTKTITGADGKNFTLNGGSSNKSTNTTQAVTLGQTLFASTPVITGAIGYAWFVGAVGAETLQAITTINSVTITAPLTTGRQAATAITQDSSANPGLAFDGLLTTAFNPANLAYVASQATGTAGTGTPLTASGTGTVVEIDNMLQSMWDNYRISPTVMYVNSQEMKNIKNKCLTSSSAPLLRIEQPVDEKGFAMTAGGRMSWYFNPFQVEGGTMIPVKVHPNIPAGTLVSYAEKLPPWYQSNEVPNVCEVVTRRDYYQINWPMRTYQREYGVYAEECLVTYFPPAMGVITNIANG
jgi:hypothetical protein